MSTARVLARVTAGLAAAGAVLVGVALALVLLLPAEDGEGPDIGAGVVLVHAVLLVALSTAIGITALVARALHRRP